MAFIQGQPAEEVMTRLPQLQRPTGIGKSTPRPAADTIDLKALKIALRLVGVTFIFGIALLCKIWPSGWAWQHGHSNYLDMILAVYATLGVFLLMASRNPLANLSLIWFTVWSSVAHAVVMAIQSLVNPEHMAHMWGDVPALLLVAALLTMLTPRQRAESRQYAGGRAA